MLGRMIDETSNIIGADGYLPGLRLNELPDVLFPFREEDIAARESFRYFDRNQAHLTLADLQQFASYFDKLRTGMDISEEALSLHVIDNAGVVDPASEASVAYRYGGGNFQARALNEPIGRESLYIQEEMHDAGAVLFFVWKLNFFKEQEMRDRYYRDLMILSGFFGHQCSLLASNRGIKGTVFAGLSPIEFYSVFQDSEDEIPIFAFAIE